MHCPDEIVQTATCPVVHHPDVRDSLAHPEIVYETPDYPRLDVFPYSHRQNLFSDLLHLLGGGRPLLPHVGLRVSRHEMGLAVARV